MVPAPLLSPETLPVVADAARAVNPWAALAYLASGILFILALRGLSHPATSRAGNRYGMIGMGIAVGTTLVTHVPVATVLSSAVLPGAIIAWTFDTLDYATLAQIVAAIALEVERTNRGRYSEIADHMRDGLTPRRALELYLQTKNIPDKRRERLLQAADGLLSRDA